MVGDIILALIEIVCDIAISIPSDINHGGVKGHNYPQSKNNYYDNYQRAENWDNAVATYKFYEGKIETVDANGKKVIDKSGASYNPNMIKGTGLTISKGGVSGNSVYNFESQKSMSKPKVISKPKDKASSYNPNMVTGNNISISASGVNKVERIKSMPKPKVISKPVAGNNISISASGVNKVENNNVVKPIIEDDLKTLEPKNENTIIKDEKLSNTDLSKDFDIEKDIIDKKIEDVLEEKTEDIEITEEKNQNDNINEAIQEESIIIDPYDERGFNSNGYHKNGTKRDNEGFDKDGYSVFGYDRDGFDREGYNRLGYDKQGFDRNGYDYDGYNKDGFDRFGLKKNN